MLVNNLSRKHKREKSAKPPLAVVGSQISYDEEMFGAAFDGIVIRRFWEFVKPYKRMLYLGIGAVLLFTLSQVAIPLLLRLIIDDALVLETNALTLLDQIVIAFGIVIVINYVANITQEMVVGRMAGHLLFDLRRAMYLHLQFVSLSFMDKTEVGRLMSRLQGDVNALQEFLETSIFALGDLVLLFGIIAVLMYLDPQLGILTLSVVPVLFIVRIVWLPHARRAFLEARETHSTVTGALAENVHGVRTIQEMNRERVNLTLYKVKAKENLDANLRASMLSNIMVPIVDTLTGAAMAIVVVVGGRMVLSSELNLGVMVAFIFYVQRFFDPVRTLTIQYSIMQRAMAAGQRIFEVLDVPITVRDNSAAKTLPRNRNDIEFKNVSFGYEPDRQILKNINFYVATGETVALVGPTGSGKSTITALVHRFYDVSDGEVLVGATNVRNLKQTVLGQHIAVVLQEPFLFTGTVFDNIRYNCKTATKKEVEAAAKAVGAHEFIEKLPKGYKTELEQRGGNLSLGQRQLISFARALAANAPILVLDEATASVDSYTERKIQKALVRLLEGRTAIVIAHRLATIRNADRVLVLRDGEIIERGTHDQLIDQNGLYSRLYKLNHASFDDIEHPDKSISEKQ